MTGGRVKKRRPPPRYLDGRLQETDEFLSGRQSLVVGVQREDQRETNRGIRSRVVTCGRAGE